MNEFNYIAKNIKHPGVYLSESIQENGFSVAEFAARVVKPTKTIYAIIKGESSITPEMAKSVSNVLGTKPEFWINMQKGFDLENAENIIEGNIDKALKEKWIQEFHPKTYSDLLNHNLVKKTKIPKERVRSFFNYFAINSSRSLLKIYSKHIEASRFRSKNVDNKSKILALVSFVRYGEIASKRLIVDNFNKDVLESNLSLIKEILWKKEEGFKEQLVELLAECGIKLIFSPKFTGLDVIGSFTYIGENPVIQITDKGKRYDRFCFTLAHEIGHCKLHGKNFNSIDFDTNSINLDRDYEKKEFEANNFARKFLLSPGLEVGKVDGKYFSELNSLFDPESTNYMKFPSFCVKYKVHETNIIGAWLHENPEAYKSDYDLVNKVTSTFRLEEKDYILNQ
ncbi:HigA family addiction module antitoxin [Candidatus Kapabacteria bacterium]|nr:HigA family addiction module antitoxin [Candidatus Kapabacteria bacterium]